MSGYPAHWHDSEHEMPPVGKLVLAHIDWMDHPTTERVRPAYWYDGTTKVGRTLMKPGWRVMFGVGQVSVVGNGDRRAVRRWAYMPWSPDDTRGQ